MTARTPRRLLATAPPEGRETLTLRERLVRAAAALERRGGTASADAARVRRLLAGYQTLAGEERGW